MRAAGEMPHVNGIGHVPHKFLVSIPFDFDDPKKLDNHHDEANVVTQCIADADDIADDTFEIAGTKTDKGYRLEIVTNSESSIRLWNSGRIIYDYDEDTERWSMSAFWKPLLWFNSEWKLCNATAIHNTILSGIRCFADTQPAAETAESLSLVAGRLLSSLQGAAIPELVAQAPRWDCAAAQREQEARSQKMEQHANEQRDKVGFGGAGTGP